MSHKLFIADTITCFFCQTNILVLCFLTLATFYRMSSFFRICLLQSIPYQSDPIDHNLAQIRVIHANITCKIICRTLTALIFLQNSVVAGMALEIMRQSYVRLIWEFGDKIVMLATFFRYVGDFLNVLNRSPTSQSCLQHIWSPTSVTNIDVTQVYASLRCAQIVIIKIILTGVIPHRLCHLTVRLSQWIVRTNSKSLISWLNESWTFRKRVLIVFWAYILHQDLWSSRRSVVGWMTKVGSLYVHRRSPFSQHFFDEFVFCLGTPFRNTSLDQKDFRPENWQKWTKMTKTWFSKC